MVSFLRLVRETSFDKHEGGLATYSRSELNSIYLRAFGSMADSPEVFDLLAYNGLLDAESKHNGFLNGFFVTDLGIEFLRRPDQFVVEEGEVTRRATTKVDATSWTGKQLILTDEQVISDLRIKVSELRDKVHSMRIESNSDSQDLKGLVEALVSLSDMAAPDLGVIERILAHPKFKIYAALAGGIATIRGMLGI